jgi:hypothetical protein
MPAGCYIANYEWSQSNPRPYLDIANNKILFSGSGLIWNILIKDSANNPLYFLYCCEGSGNDAGNQTVHNGYANDYTKHFLINALTKWAKVYRDNVYRWGHSTKTGLGLTSIEKVPNGTFTSDVSGWTVFTNYTISRDTTYFVNGGAKIYYSGGGVPQGNGGAYTSFSTYKIFRYTFSGQQYLTMAMYGGIAIGIDNKAYYLAGWQNLFAFYGNLNIGLTSYSGVHYFPGNSVYLTLYHSNDPGTSFYADNISTKIYEDAIKIPSLITNRTKDCLGNTLTP